MNNFVKNEEKFLTSPKTSNLGGLARECGRGAKKDKKISPSSSSSCEPKTNIHTPSSSSSKPNTNTHTVSSSSSKPNTNTHTVSSSSSKPNTNTHTVSSILSSPTKWWRRDPVPSASSSEANKYTYTPPLTLSSPAKTPNQASRNSVESTSQNPRCLQEDFERYAEKAKTLLTNTTNVNKLILYGLYMQATVGDVKTRECFSLNKQDSATTTSDFNTERAKRDAWEAAEGISKEEAMNRYINKVKLLLQVAGRAA